MSLSSQSPKERAETLRCSGNQQFVRKNYEAAIKCYTQAIQLDPLSSVLFSNRAQCYLNLKRFSEALKDAEAALEIDDANAKARYRKATALYAMRKYEEAMDESQKLFTTFKESKELFLSAVQRLDEQQHGRYNMAKMLEEARLIQPPILDYAEYIGPIRVTEVPGKGRGMVATKNIVAGTLLLCSKAYAIAFRSEVEQKQISSKHLVRLAVAFRLNREPWTMAEVFNLYAGANMPPVTAGETDIDVERIYNIVLHNSFQLAYELWTDLRAPISPYEGSDEGTGLWILPSYINHSCLANARYHSIGDFMFVRAIHDIAENEEVCVSYVDPLDTYEERTARLQGRDFKCQCLLCDFGRKHPEITRRRLKLMYHFQKIRPLIGTGAISMLPELTNIVAQLRKTYRATEPKPEHHSEGKETERTRAVTPAAPQLIPQLDLFRPLSALSHLYHCKGQLRMARQTLLEAFEKLPRLGGTSSVSLARADVALHIRGMFVGDESNCRHWMNVAREEFEVIYGKEERLWQDYLSDYNSAVQGG